MLCFLGLYKIFIHEVAFQLRSDIRSTDDALAPLEKGETLQDRVKDLLVQNVMDDK